MKTNEFPDIVFKRKWLSKTKAVIIFRRNNLAFKDFIQTENGYYYQETFFHHGTRGIIKISVNDKDMYKLFDIDYESAKVKGGKDHFGIFLCLPDQVRLPLHQKGSFGCMDFELLCAGGSLYCEGRKKRVGAKRVIPSMTKPIDIPDSVSWAASHPYGGGGMNPR